MTVFTVRVGEHNFNYYYYYYYNYYYYCRGLKGFREYAQITGRPDCMVRELILLGWAP